METATAISSKQISEKRFSKILKALKFGLETTVLKSTWEAAKENGLIIPEGMSISDPNSDGSKPDAKAIYLRHIGDSNGVNLENDLIFSPSPDAEPLVITFQKIPGGLDYLFQRMHFRHIRKGSPILGLQCSRFTMFPERPEPPSFSIKYKRKDEIQREQQEKNLLHGDIWLDWYSKTECWNPLFVKYHFQVAPALKALEYGYLKIDAGFDEEKNIVITVSRIPETAVPEGLKTAFTFPH